MTGEPYDSGGIIPTELTRFQLDADECLVVLEHDRLICVHPAHNAQTKPLHRHIR